MSRSRRRGAGTAAAVAHLPKVSGVEAREREALLEAAKPADPFKAERAIASGHKIFAAATIEGLMGDFPGAKFADAGSLEYLRGPDFLRYSSSQGRTPDRLKAGLDEIVGRSRKKG